MRAPPILSLRRRTVVIPVLAAALVIAAACATSSSPAGATSALPSSLALTSQTPAVVTHSSGLTLRVAVRSSLPASALGINVTLFDKAQYVDTFEQTLKGSPAGLGVMSGTAQSIPLSTFEHSADGSSFPIYLPVSAPDLPGNPRTPRRGALLQVSCSPGQCGGVYPLLVSLTDLTGATTLDTFMTYLVLAPPSETSQTSPLRFAWVMTVGARPAVTASGTGQPSASDEGLVSQLATATASYPGVPLNLNLVPQFVRGLALDSSSRTSRSTLASLRSMATSPSFEVIPAPFANVDLTALRQNGLSGDVALQVQEGRATLRQYLGTAGRTNEYVSLGSVGGAAAAMLDASGINTIVVPSSSVQPASPTNIVYAVLAPFVVRNAGLEAVASEPGLETHLGGEGNAILRANQLLANLAELFFQVPTARKGVALLSPASFAPGSAFLQTVMAGLSGSPLVTASTVSQLFAQVPPGSAGGAATLRTRSLQGSPAPQLGGQALAAGRGELQALESIEPSSTAMIRHLTENYLLAETAGLSPAGQAAYLGVISRTLDSIGSELSLPFGHTITLTALNAKVPLSIVSKAAAPLVVKLSVSGPELGFATRRSYTIRLLPHTNVVPIQLTARTSGDFPLEIEILSPNGSYVLLSGSVTIRSTAISGVAVAISVAALAFLVIWWSRSTMKRRRTARQRHSIATASTGSIESGEA